MQSEEKNRQEKNTRGKKNHLIIHINDFITLMIKLSTLHRHSHSKKIQNHMNNKTKQNQQIKRGK